MSMALGVILGNRDFFPDQLITEARRDIAQCFEVRHQSGLAWPGDKLGSVET